MMKGTYYIRDRREYSPDDPPQEYGCVVGYAEALALKRILELDYKKHLVLVKATPSEFGRDRWGNGR